MQKKCVNLSVKSKFFECEMVGLGRRQLREKVVQTLYAYQQNPKSIDLVLKNMIKEISKIYDLYIYELNFLVAIHQLAKEQIEIGKRKYIKSDNDINPSLKFIENRVLIQIINNYERVLYTTDHKQLKWDTDNELVVKTYQRIRSGKRYKDYMESIESSFEEDQKFIGKLFLRYVAENEDLHDLLEDKEMAWSDDLHIANSLIQKTIGFMKPEENHHMLIKINKNYDDKSFAEVLLLQTVLNWDKNQKKLKDRLQNWDLERLSLIDKVILITAFSEMEEFKSTPSSIIISEYIEISKVFSSEKSNVFINGVLGKYAKDISRV